MSPKKERHKLMYSMNVRRIRVSEGGTDCSMCQDQAPSLGGQIHFKLNVVVHMGNNSKTGIFAPGLHVYIQ